MTEEKKIKKRSGSTNVTSVSVSEEFQKLIAQYNLSPTECFRRGIAVTLFDLGVGMYQSKKNEDRSKYMHEFLGKITKDEKIKEKEEDIGEVKELVKQMENVQNRILDKVIKWQSSGENNNDNKKE